MAVECFNCATPAAERYTLALGESTDLDDVVLCHECFSDFRNVEWIEVERLPTSS
jgi:hypothetical protein